MSKSARRMITLMSKMRLTMLNNKNKESKSIAKQKSLKAVELPFDFLFRENNNKNNIIDTAHLETASTMIKSSPVQ